MAAESYPLVQTGPPTTILPNPPIRRVVLGAILALGLTSVGCVSMIVGDQDTEMKFLVKPEGSGNFYGWTNITLHEDTSQVNSATLDFIQLSRLDDTTGGDLTFIHSLKVDAGPPGSAVLVADKMKMPKGERSVPLDIVYHDDLKALFPDGHTIHVDWTGAADTTGLPAEGVWIKVHVRVHIE